MKIRYLLALAFGLTIAFSLHASTRKPSHSSTRPKPTFSLDRELAFFEDRVKKSPDSFQALAQLSSLYVKKAKTSGDPSYFDQAEKMARQSIRIFPSPPAQLTLAQVEEARHHFAEAIAIAHEVAKDSSSPVGSGSVLVTSYLARGELVEASREADKLVDAKPALGTYSLRALVMAAMGRVPEAFEDFENALRVEDYGEFEESAWVHAVYARELMRAGRYEAAKRQLNASLENVPDFHLALNFMGELALRQGDAAGAQEFFRRALSQSRQVVYLARLARAQVALGERDAGLALLKQAEDMIRREIASGGFGHRLELAKILLYRAEVERARPALFTESESLTRQELSVRGTTEARLLYARASLGLSHLTQAEDSIREAMRSGLEDSELFYQASLIERESGNPRRAAFFARRAFEINPNFAPDRTIDL